MKSSHIQMKILKSLFILMIQVHFTEWQQSAMQNLSLTEITKDMLHS